MKKCTVARHTENTAIARTCPRPVPPLQTLLWDYAGTEARHDREGSTLLAGLIARATHAEAQR